MTCKAMQCNDQMICGRCGLQWDVNDPMPPACLTGEELAAKTCNEIYKELER